MVTAVVTAVLSLVGLVFNFVGRDTKVAGYSTTDAWNLGKWFENINDLQDLEEIKNWQIARVLVIITAVLLVAMLVVMLIKLVAKRSAVLQWVTFGLAIMVCAGAVATLVTILDIFISLNDYILKISYF